MKSTALGYCGLDCAKCPVFIATARDDDALRRRTAEEWSERYAAFLEKPLKPEDMNCPGCRSNRNTFPGALKCPIRTCCRGKKLDTCADCSSYESCEMLNVFFTQHPEAKANLDEICLHR